MVEHYYSHEPTVDHNRRIIEVMLRGRTMKFITDAGVFSKSDVDYGSKLLIEALQLPDHAQVLDMGCGYGPIGLCAAFLNQAGHVTMADVNERALKLAEENAHLNHINVRIGQTLRQGQILGLSGQTGLVTGPHLHWSVIRNGVRVNPLRFLADKWHNFRQYHHRGW